MLLDGPGAAEQDKLEELRAMTGLRAMIASHPTRNGFHLGFAPLDAVWYGAPYLHAPYPAIHENETFRDCDWTCTGEGEGEDDYCLEDNYTAPDPIEPQVSCLTLPVEDPSVRDYLEHEFNTVWPIASLQPSNVARRAVWDTGDEEFVPHWQFGTANKDVDFAVDADMALCGGFIAYWLPAWAAFGGAASYAPSPQPDWAIAAETLAGSLYLHEIVMMGHYAQGATAGRFHYWAVANEAIRAVDQAADSGNLTPLAAILRWNSLLPRWPGSTWAIDPHFYWTWFLLSEPYIDNGKWKASDPEYAVATLKMLYRIARYADPNAKLLYNDHGMEFEYTMDTNGDPVNQLQYQRLLTLIDDFQDDNPPVPLDAIGLQMHLAAWSVLTYDANVTGNIRLNPNELKSLRDSIRNIGLEGLKVAITELDVRCGAPDAGTQQWDSLSLHLKNHATLWTGTGSPPDATATFNLRANWQGTVYEAVLNACLADPALDAIIFFDLSDESSWIDLSPDRSLLPNCPMYPDPAAARPCLFGDDPQTKPGSQADYGKNPAYREKYFPKPAYYGVRNAITNYFGPAFVIRDANGDELVRFVENGNVLLMKPEAQVHTGQSNLNQIASSEARFIVKNASGEFVAVVTNAGHLYLKHDLTESVADLTEPQGSAFVIKNRNCEVASYIDSEGYMKLRAYDGTPEDGQERGGYVLVCGIPYRLRSYEASDPYLQ